MINTLINLIEQGSIDEALDEFKRNAVAIKPMLMDLHHLILKTLYATQTTQDRSDNWISFACKLSEDKALCATFPILKYLVINLTVSLPTYVNKTHDLSTTRFIFDSLLMLYQAKEAIIKSLSNKPGGEDIILHFAQNKMLTESISIESIGRLKQFFLETYNQPLFKLFDSLARRYLQENVNSFLLGKENIRQSTLLKNLSPEIATKLNDIFRQLKFGFGQIKYSKEEESAAPFLLAAIRHDKKRYDFNPTLVHKTQFEAYLRSIQQAPFPIRERFIIQDTHWTAGEMLIDDAGNVKIFLADSQGFSTMDEIFFKDLLKKIGLADIFKHKKIDIYHPMETRQYTPAGCSVFALEDARQLFTLDNSLDEKTVFSYLGAHIQHSAPLAEGSNINIHICNLPHSLLRSMQSRTLLQTLEQNRSPNAVNKRNETAIESARSEFIFDQSLNKVSNSRLERKFDVMTNRLNNLVLEKLEQHPEEGFAELCDMANDFTLQAFQHRIGLLSLVKETTTYNPVASQQRYKQQIVSIKDKQETTKLPSPS